MDMQAGQTKLSEPLSEDRRFMEELHKRSAHAQEQANHHYAEARMWQRISEAAYRALERLETEDSDAQPEPSFGRIHRQEHR